MSRARILVGDCMERMRELDEASVDSIVGDPPYGIEFMGKTWDSPTRMVGEATGISGGFNRIPAGVPRPDMDKTDSALFQQWCEAWAIEALRVLKPGGHLLAFGGTRMYHRLACGIEDAGFEIRDTIAWMYGSGFPKSHNVANSIDKSLGHANRGRAIPTASSFQASDVDEVNKLTSNKVEDYEARSPEAEPWEGWGTALKPAHEPIIVARKPLRVGKKKATVAKNVLEHGTGAINIDATRVGTEEMVNQPGYGRWNDYRHEGKYIDQDEGAEPTVAQGRWPANVILDAEAGALLDEQAGVLTSGKAPGGLKRNADKFRSVYGEFAGQDEPDAPIYGDSGGASRFFYQPKANKKEKLAGIPDDLATKLHPTTKPVDLMRYLCRLVTPPEGLVLDPFMGSGTTGVACVLEGFDFLGIEREQDYVNIAAARIKHWKATMPSEVPA